MLTTIGLVVLAGLAILAIVIATRPSAFRIARSTTIDAPSDVVFALLDDLRAWRAWSPFEKLDADIQRSFDGPASGVGAIYRYAGAKAGAGSMTVTESQPGRRLVIRAEFIKPFAATNQIDFTLEPAGKGVAITWAMTGTNGFVFKAFSLVFNMDRVLGREFDKGLADPKRVAEDHAQRRATVSAAV